MQNSQRVIVRRRAPAGVATVPPLELAYRSPYEKLVQKIRERAPAHGSLDLRITFQDDRPIDVIFITGEERVRLDP